MPGDLVSDREAPATYRGRVISQIHGLIGASILLAIPVSLCVWGLVVGGGWRILGGVVLLPLLVVVWVAVTDVPKVLGDWWTFKVLRVEGTVRRRVLLANGKVIEAYTQTAEEAIRRSRARRGVELVDGTLHEVPEEGYDRLVDGAPVRLWIGPRSGRVHVVG